MFQSRAPIRDFADMDIEGQNEVHNPNRVLVHQQTSDRLKPPNPHSKHGHFINARLWRRQTEHPYEHNEYNPDGLYIMI